MTPLIWPNNRWSQIWVMDADGDSRSPLQLTRGTTDGRTGLAPLPDGRVAFMRRNADSWEIWATNADGPGENLLYAGNPIIDELRMSADGRVFVFNAQVDGSYQLFRVNTDGSGLMQLTFGEETYASDSTVSPDGTTVVYMHFAYRGSGSAADYSLNRMSASGGPSEPVPGAPDKAIIPHYSPAGDAISLIDSSRTPAKLCTLSMVDKSSRCFEMMPGALLSVGGVWSPDGKSLVYITEDGKASNVWRQPVDGGPPVRITNFTSGRIYRAAYSPDGKRLYMARGYAVNDALLVKGFHR